MPTPTSQKRPAFIPAPGCAQVEMRYLHLGQHCENVYHVTNNAVAPGNAQTIAASLNAAFQNWEKNFASNDRLATTTFQGTVVRFLDAQDSPAYEFPANAGIVGAGSGSPQPGNVTVAVKWLTARRGRSFRGRTFHIGLAPSMFTGNVMVEASRLDMITNYGHLITDLQTPTGYSLCVLSFAANKFWRDQALATPITQVAIDSNLDSQRRRLAGRGN